MLRKISFLFLFILAALYFAPNLFMYHYPFVRIAPIKCRVVDVETGEPIPGVTVNVSLYRMHFYKLHKMEIGSSHTKEDLRKTYVTDTKGEFYSPRMLFYDSFCGFPLFDNVRISFSKAPYEEKAFRIFNNSEYYMYYLRWFKKGHNRNNVIKLNRAESIVGGKEITAVIEMERE